MVNTDDLITISVATDAATHATIGDDCVATHATGGATQWITVARAAELEGVSPRAIQRRCEKDKYRNRRVQTPQGERIEVDAATLSATATHATQSRDDGDQRRDAHDHEGRDSGDVRRDARDDEDIESPSIIPFEVLENPQNSDRVQVNHEVELLRVQLDNAREVIGREREFSALLKSQLEAVTQSEAQTKAALREALKFQAKQLGPAPTDATTPPDRAPIGQAENLAPKHTEAARSPQTDTGAAPKKELRPLWKVILGVR